MTTEIIIVNKEGPSTVKAQVINTYKGQNSIVEEFTVEPGQAKAAWVWKDQDVRIVEQEE